MIARSLAAIDAWDLESLGSMGSRLADDAHVAESTGDRLHDAAETALEGCEGESAGAVHDTCYQLRADLHRWATLHEAILDQLRQFREDVGTHRTRLREIRQRAEDGGIIVADDGGLEIAGGHSTPAREQLMGELQDDMTTHLHAVGDCDRRVASRLAELAGLAPPPPREAPNYTDNYDPSSSVAGVAVSVQTDGLAALLKEAADEVPAGATAKGVARGLPYVGTALGLAAGIAGSPDGESMKETLIAEGGGTLSGMIVGGLLGSAVPVAGTIVGAVGGGAVGYGVSLGIRTGFDDKRADDDYY